MTDAKVELVLRVFDGVNRQDADAVLSAFDATAEMSTLTSLFVHGTSYEGHDAIRGYLEGSLPEVWGDVEMVADETRTVGDTVLVRGRWRSRGRSSGAQVEMPAAWLFTIRDGRIVQSRAFRNEEEAMAGLES